MFMKMFKNTIFYALIKCWKEIAISDKALIIIIFILLIQCIYNLFTPEPINSNEITICIVVRTSVASIFGYFLSENFLNHNKAQVKSPATKINALSQDNSTKNNSKIYNNYDINKIDEKNKSVINKSTSKYYICNRTLQVIIALSVCIIALTSLLIAYDFNLVSEDSSPTIIQFRDLIGSCVGFLLGSSKNTTKTSTNKKY